MEEDKREVVLFAATNIHGSASSCDMGYTVTEWKAMTTDEQTQIIHEYMANIVDIWVEAEDGEQFDQ